MKAMFNTKMTEMTKKAGRPAGRKQDRPFQMRVDDDFVAQIDNWRRQQPDFPNRTQAIRRLIETHPEIVRAGKDGAAKERGKGQ
jgi:hypothetical protein